MSLNFLKFSPLWLWPIIGGVGLVIFIAFYAQAFPEASFHLNITKGKALEQAENYIEELGFEVSDYQHAVIFNPDNPTSAYLQRTLGIQETIKRLKKEFPVWLWQVRFFKPLQKEEFQVSIDASTGKIIKFERLLEEEAEGVKLPQDQARRIAIGFLSQKYNLEEYKEISASTKEEKNRTDHSFAWEKKDYEIGEARVRLAINIQGDKVGYFSSPSLRIPEEFSRNLNKIFARGTLLAIFSFFFTFILTLAAFAVFIKKYKQKQIKWRVPFIFSLIFVVVGVAHLVNNFSQISFFMPTEIESSVFFATTILGSLIIFTVFGLLIFLFTAAGESLNREILKRPLFSLKFQQSLLVGYSLIGVTLGMVTVFYLLANRYLGAWTSLLSLSTQHLSVILPVLLPITIGISAALSEETLFRLFSITFLKKYLRYSWLALFIPAIIWGFSHSNYPVFPIWIRGIEVTLIGLLAGYIFWRHGLFPTLIWHFGVNTILVAIPLLRAGSNFYLIQGIFALTFLLLPLILAFVLLKHQRLKNELRPRSNDRGLNGNPPVGNGLERELEAEPKGSALAS